MPAPTSQNPRPIDRRTVGLILIAIMLVLYTLLRWGHHIPWSAR